MNNIDKQSIDLIGDAYKNFEKQFGVVKEDIESFILKRKMIEESLFPDKNEFIRLIKTNNDFAKQWGVIVEVRELSLRERVDIFNLKMIKEGIRTQIATVGVFESYWKKSLEETKHNIPKRAISLTYNNQTIESYE
jgi:hypothetical protein